MKIPALIALAFLCGGCALIDGGGRQAVLEPSAATPARTPARAAAEPFRAAYGIGRPVALVPCARGATLNDDCAGGETRHQLSGELEAAAAEPLLPEISPTPVAK